MNRYFNTTGVYYPDRHYMVDLQSRLEEIKELIDRGSYFMINRARQYGKTTMLKALKRYFRDMWLVVHSLATLIVTGGCPYSEQEMGEILTGFSSSLCKAIKEIPGFAENHYDRDKIFGELVEKTL